MVIAQIKKIRLSANAQTRLSFAAYTSAEKYIAGLDIDRHFKMVVADGRGLAIHAVAEMLKRQLVPEWLECKGVSPCDFTFTLMFADVDDAGCFWPPSGEGAIEYTIS